MINMNVPSSGLTSITSHDLSASATQTTTSTSYTDLSTAGPTVTPNPGSTLNYIFYPMTWRTHNAAADDFASLSIAGVAASDNYGLYCNSTIWTTLSRAMPSLSVLTNQTTLMKYRVVSGTGSWAGRYLLAVGTPT